MNNRINASNWTQDLHQVAHENQANIPSSFSDLQSISNLPEDLSYPYHRVEASATADLRSPGTTSGEVHLSGEQNSTALTQGRLEPSEPKQKLVPVPPEYRRDNENERTLISPNALALRKYRRKRVPVPPEYRRGNEDEHTRISPKALSLRKYRRIRVSVPLEYRRNNENEHARISFNALALRKRNKLKSAALSGENLTYHRVETSAAADLRSPSTTSDEVPLSGEHNSTVLAQGRLEPSESKEELVSVPPKYRLENEDEHTRIRPNALRQRKYRREHLPVPPEYWLPHENEHTRISTNALLKRKSLRERVSVPPEFRRGNEDEHTKISPNALALRKHKKLKAAAFSGEKPHARHQAGEASAVNTLTGSSSARQNSPILTRSPLGSNASVLHETATHETTTHEATTHETTTHETTPLGSTDIYESLSPFESESAFSHWLDDVNAQQSAIDYIQNCYW